MYSIVHFSKLEDSQKKAKEWLLNSYLKANTDFKSCPLKMVHNHRSLVDSCNLTMIKHTSEVEIHTN